MADLYISIRLLTGSKPKPTSEEYVSFANLLIKKVESDPEIVGGLKFDGKDAEVSVQIQGFDPIISFLLLHKITH